MHPLIQGLLTHPMAKRQPVRTIGRILRWQLFGPRYQPIPVEFGQSSKLLVKKGMAGATGNVYYGLHEFDEMIFLLKVLRQSDLFVDIGANIGSYSVLIANEVGCRVKSFEPNPTTFRALVENIKLNDLFSVCETHQKGVGADSGNIGFTDGLDTVNHVEFKAGAIEVPIVALDDLDWTFDGSIYMKIDVEGFESFVIDGGEKLFSSGKVALMMMELNGSSDS